MLHCENLDHGTLYIHKNVYFFLSLTFDPNYPDKQAVMWLTTQILDCDTDEKSASHFRMLTKSKNACFISFLHIPCVPSSDLQFGEGLRTEQHTKVGL